MKCSNPCRIILLVSLGIPAFAGVTVSTPSNGGTVSSPVNYVASASSSCSKGVASMGVYVDNQLETVVDGDSMNTSVTISDGSHKTVVQEWDNCGGSTTAAVAITVGGGGGSGVTVSAPSNGGTVSSPVNYVATASSTCSKGVASMGIYVNNTLTYVGQGASLNTNLNLDAGSYKTVVEEWDHCGGASYTPINITVSSGGGGGGGGNEFTELQASNGWIAYGEYPPKYGICTDCGGGVTWSIKQHQNSPSKSGNSTEYTIGGNHPYSDVLFTIPLIGTNSSQGMPDPDHKIIPNLHDFTYDVYFYGANLSLSEVLEFDIDQFFDGMGFIFGHQCEIAAGHQWDIWDNVNKHWDHTGIACNPISNSWNHLTLDVERTTSNELLYKTITFNGTTYTLNKTYPHYNSGDWYGVVVNYQMDGNSNQSSYSAYLDDFTFTYQ
jgi:hypothetical protein